MGVAVDQFNKIDEASKDALQSAFKFAYGIGAAFDAADKISAVANWTSDQEKYKQVMDLTVASGWDQVDVIDALVDGGDKLDRLTEAYAANGAASGLTNGRLQELDAILPSIKNGLAEGANAAQAQAEYLFKLSQEAGQATGEVDALGNIIVKLPGDVEVAVNAETQTATTDIQRIKDDINSVPDSHATTLTARARSHRRNATWTGSWRAVAARRSASRPRSFPLGVSGSNGRDDHAQHRFDHTGSVDPVELDGRVAVVIHPILGRADDDVTFRPASLRRGVLHLVFADAEAAYTARAALLIPQRLALTHTTVAVVAMTFVVAEGEVSDVLAESSQWSIDVPFREVLP